MERVGVAAGRISRGLRRRRRRLTGPRRGRSAARWPRGRPGGRRGRAAGDGRRRFRSCSRHARSAPEDLQRLAGRRGRLVVTRVSYRGIEQLDTLLVTAVLDGRRRTAAGAAVVEACSRLPCGRSGQHRTAGSAGAARRDRRGAVSPIRPPCRPRTRRASSRCSGSSITTSPIRS